MAKHHVQHNYLSYRYRKICRCKIRTYAWVVVILFLIWANIRSTRWKASEIILYLHIALISPFLHPHGILLGCLPIKLFEQIDEVGYIFIAESVADIGYVFFFEIFFCRLELNKVLKFFWAKSRFLFESWGKIWSGHIEFIGNGLNGNGGIYSFF